MRLYRLNQWQASGLYILGGVGFAHGGHTHSPTLVLLGLGLSSATLAYRLYCFSHPEA